CAPFNSWLVVTGEKDPAPFIPAAHSHAGQDSSRSQPKNGSFERRARRSRAGNTDTMCEAQALDRVFPSSQVNASRAAAEFVTSSGLRAHVRPFATGADAGGGPLEGETEFQGGFQLMEWLLSRAVT